MKTSSFCFLLQIKHYWRTTFDKLLTNSTNLQTFKDLHILSIVVSYQEGSSYYINLMNLLILTLSPKHVSLRGKNCLSYDLKFLIKHWISTLIWSCLFFFILS